MVSVTLPMYINLIKSNMIQEELKSTITVKFNLERALAGERVITRAGKEVVHLSYIDIEDYQDPKIFAVVKYGDKYEKIFCHDDGYYYSNQAGSYNDLQMFPKGETIYANLYKNLEGVIYVEGDYFDTYDEAVNSIDKRRVYLKTISI